MNDKDYQAILAKLTLDEKVCMCSGSTTWLTQPIKRDDVDIPAVRMSDGPVGLRREKISGGVNIMQIPEPATCFPGAVTTASSWDEDLIEEVGHAIAVEAQSLGVSTVLGPGVNIKRSPLCGRNFEYFSEDPFLAGRMGAAWVHGVQKTNVGTSLKHYLANNQEYIRMCIDSIVDERTLREIYMPAFEHIVKTEHPTTVMCSYNRLNGTYLSDNKRFLTDVLRDEWGYKGIVVSDWGAVNNRSEGIKAGMDLEMPGGKGIGFNGNNIYNALENGTLTEEDIDKVVLRLIKFAYENKVREVDGVTYDIEEHNQIARRAAEGGAVLLKNDGALPLKANQSIAVIGKLAKKLRYQGGGSSHILPHKVTSFLDALDNAGQKYEYADGYTLKGEGYKKSLIKKAVKAAKGKDAVLLFIGLTDAFESEGYDRSHIKMPTSHVTLVNELLKVNKNVIVVLSCGSPVEIGEWDKGVKAILNVYLGGQAGGEATYNLLYGKVNPSGKLAETFPVCENDYLGSKYFRMGPRTVEYRESVYVGYRYYDSAKKQVKYPFGYGLSYTAFEYSNLRLSATDIRQDEPLTVTFTVKNTGKVAGAEIAQLYVKDTESTLYRPEKELKGFKKVFLNPGEEKDVTLTLDSRAFAYYNVAIKDWHVESGDFAILVGASSRDIKLEGHVNVTSANPDAPIPDYTKSAPAYYDIANAKEIPTEQFEALYGAKMIENTPFKKGEFTANNTIGQCNVKGFGRFMYRLAVGAVNLVALSAENPEMLTNSVKDMPYRTIASWSMGLITDRALAGMVDMLNGKKGGFRRFLKGLGKDKKAKQRNK